MGRTNRNLVSHLLCLNDTLKVLVQAEAEVEFQCETPFLKARVTVQEVVACDLLIGSPGERQPFQVVVRDGGYGDLAADLPTGLPHRHEIRGSG